MHLNHTKIQQHKVDIEKRIMELEKKLKQPVRNSQILGQSNFIQRNSQVEPDWRHQPAERYRQDPPVQDYRRKQYVEHPDVEEIRRRNIVEKKMPIIEVGIENRLPNYQPYQPQTRKYEDQRIKPEGKTIHNTSSFAEKNRNMVPQVGNYRYQQSSSANNNNELYDMMAMILQNQKNLQQEIGVMRSEWGKEKSQNFGNTKMLETPFQAFNQSALRNSNVERRDESKTFEIRNFQQQNNKLTEEKSKKKGKMAKQYSFQNRKINESLRNQPQEHQRPNFNQTQSEIRPNDTQPHLRQNKGIQKAKPATHKKNTAIDIHNLVKNQKNRTDRLVASQQDKRQFWKKVESRIRQSQKEYRDTFHRNNRHEHEHLIGTSELQKKLKGDLLQKIYSQSNSCMYK